VTSFRIGSDSSANCDSNAICVDPVIRSQLDPASNPVPCGDYWQNQD